MLARSCKISQAGTGVAFVVLGLWGKAWRAACYLSVSWWRLPAFQSCTCAFLSGTKQTQAKENNKYKEERKNISMHIPGIGIVTCGNDGCHQHHGPYGAEIHIAFI